MKKFFMLIAFILITLQTSGCDSIKEINQIDKYDDFVVVDKDKENENLIIVESNDDYEIRFVGTVYGTSTKRNILVEVENKTSDSLSFSFENLKADDKDQVREDGGLTIVKANSIEGFPLVFEEWIDFESCSGSFIIESKSRQINKSHDFNLYVIKDE